MPKNIVMCFDGTWNGKDVDEDDDGAPDSTNVFKIFGALSGETTEASRDEEERITRDEAGRFGRQT